MGDQEDPLIKLKKAIDIALFVVIFLWFLAQAGGFQ